MTVGVDVRGGVQSEFIRSEIRRPELPCWPTIDNSTIGYWTLQPEIHDTIRGSYMIKYIENGWRVVFDDARDAIMFKLSFGGS